jgi:hypothetical protein
MAETIRLEEFTGIIQNKVIAVWTESVWLPTEFMLTQYITRILVTGRASPVSVTLSADPSWTQVWRSPGAKEWSCLLGILQHMPGPVLIVVTPDIALTPKVLTALTGATTVVLRSVGSVGWPSGAEAPSHVFFPVLGAGTGPLMSVVQEWVGRAAPRSLDLKMLMPQLAAAGYGLMVAEGLWHWYKPADSPPLATLTVAQVAKQLQTLGSMLEKMVI